MNLGSLPAPQRLVGFKVLQVQTTFSGAWSGAGVTTTPLDDTIPQNTEGNLIYTTPITPLSANSTLWVRGLLQCTSGSVTQGLIACIHRDGAQASVCSLGWNQTVNGFNSLVVEGFLPANSTAPTVFTLRAGAGASNFAVNGSTAARLYGGVFNSMLQVWELAS